MMLGVSVGWILIRLIRVGTTLVLLRGITLKKLQLDRSEIAGGSICSVCDGAKGRGFGRTRSSVELEMRTSGLKLCGEGMDTKANFGDLFC